MHIKHFLPNASMKAIHAPVFPSATVILIRKMANEFKFNPMLLLSHVGDEKQQRWSKSCIHDDGKDTYGNNTQYLHDLFTR
jgi:hypothetical protein